MNISDSGPREIPCLADQFSRYSYFYLCNEWMNIWIEACVKLWGRHRQHIFIFIYVLDEWILARMRWRVELSEAGRSTKKQENAETAVFLVFSYSFAGNQVSEWHSSRSPSHIFIFIYALNEWILGPGMLMKLLPNPVSTHTFLLFTPWMNEYLEPGLLEVRSAHTLIKELLFYRRPGDE